MATVAERVALGVQKLDELAPGWRDKIDVVRLDMIHSWNCVLGQVYGGYHYALSRRFLTSAGLEAHEMGLTNDPVLEPVQYDREWLPIRHPIWAELDAEWKRVLSQ